MIALTQEKREELIESAKNIIAHDDWLWERFSGIHASSDTVYLIKIALESLTAEPVAYLSKGDIDNGEHHILARKNKIHACPLATFTAPPVPEIKLPGISALIDHQGCLPAVRDVAIWDFVISEVKRLNGLGD